jgi:uncharacterized protein (DUF488 family)
VLTRSGPTVTLYTIGYQGLTLEQFLQLLITNRIAHLVDIREAPISRKVGFAKAALCEAVEHAGIRYSHVRALGRPKPTRDRYKKDGDWSRYTRDFKIYLAGQSHALAELRATVAASRTCLLCYEADYNRCHRTFVAEAISGDGNEIQHILVRPPSPQEELPFT